VEAVFEEAARQKQIGGGAQYSAAARRCKKREGSVLFERGGGIWKIERGRGGEEIEALSIRTWDGRWGEKTVIDLQFYSRRTR